jgi:hypothetical protein
MVGGLDSRSDGFSPGCYCATAVLQRMQIPRRIVAILEGESLVNDSIAFRLPLSDCGRGNRHFFADGSSSQDSRRRLWWCSRGLGARGQGSTGFSVTSMIFRFRSRPHFSHLSRRICLLSNWGSLVSWPTLSILICALGIEDDGESHREEQIARKKANQAALAYVDRLTEDSSRRSHSIGRISRLREEYRERLAQPEYRAELKAEPDPKQLPACHFNHLLREALQVERQTLVQLRNQHEINHETLRIVQRISSSLKLGSWKLTIEIQSRPAGHKDCRLPHPDAQSLEKSSLSFIYASFRLLESENSARSISGNVCLFLERRGHSNSNELLTWATTVFGYNSMAQAWTVFQVVSVANLTREFLALAGRGEDDGRRYPLEEANAALAHLRSGRVVEVHNCESEPWFA